MATIPKIFGKDTCIGIIKFSYFSRLSFLFFQNEGRVAEAPGTPSDGSNSVDMNSTRTNSFSTNGAGTVDEPVIIMDNEVSLKSQKRDQQFKQMLKLQSQEIESTVVELKTKIFKLIQTSYTKPQQEEDMINSALTYTKRFHRALKKTMVELSHINDRVVRDYVQWKKKTDTQNNMEIKENKTSDPPR